MRYKIIFLSVGRWFKACTAHHLDQGLGGNHAEPFVFGATLGLDFSFRALVYRQ